MKIMLKIKDNVDLKELAKFGFKILLEEDEFEKRIKKDIMNLYCTRAYKNIGNHFTIVIENDEYINQITILPDSEFPLKLSFSWQLDILYDLIQAGLIEKIGEHDEI